MCRQKAQGKDMSNLWIIVCVLCWYSQTESQTVHIVENKTDWFTAYQVCTMQHGRLPSVNIYDHRVKLKDLSDTKNISSPFWIAATYDTMNYNHCEPHYADLCPDTLCQTIAISSGKQNIEWSPCWKCNNFSCAISNIEVYLEADFKWGCKDWPGAFQECKGRLGTRQNLAFLERVKTSVIPFWLDDMPQINLAPDIRMENRTCFYSFNGNVHEGNCSDTSMTTVCILVTTTGMTPTTSTMVPSQTEYTAGMTPTTSSMVPSQTEYTAGMTPTTSSMVPSQTEYTAGMTHTTSTVFPSQRVYTEGMTPTTSTMFPSQTMYTAGMPNTTSTVFPSQTVFKTGMTHTAEYSITKKTFIIVSTNRLDTSHSYMLDSAKKATEKISETQTKEIWPILGSALGGFVVIIIVVITIIIVLRRRRMKNDPEKAFNYNANNKSVTKNMSQTTNEYDTVLGESFALEATIGTSTRVSSAHEEEPVIYAQPQKRKTNCRNPIDVPFSIKQPTDEKENTGLYNVVQKGKKTHGIPNTFVNDDVLGKDYYDISFTVPGKEEAVENVYNKANFNHSGRDEDQTVNMYGKGNFSHESLENITGNDYDETNFHHEILENNTGNDYDEANFRNNVLVRDSGNEYEKEMFHRPGSSNYD